MFTCKRRYYLLSTYYMPDTRLDTHSKPSQQCRKGCVTLTAAKGRVAPTNCKNPGSETVSNLLEGGTCLVFRDRSSRRMAPTAFPVKEGDEEGPPTKGQVSFPLWGSSSRGPLCAAPKPQHSDSWRPSSTTRILLIHMAVRSPPRRGQHGPGQRARAAALGGKQDLPSVPNPPGHCCPPGIPEEGTPTQEKTPSSKARALAPQEPSGHVVVVQDPLGGHHATHPLPAVGPEVQAFRAQVIQRGLAGHRGFHTKDSLDLVVGRHQEGRVREEAMLTYLGAAVPVL